MKQMLITGGAGFIGHYLVKKFVDDFEIICIVKKETDLSRLKDVSGKIKFIIHNIRDGYDSLFEQLKNVEYILHAGANPSSESSIKSPISVVFDNVLATVQLLELSKKLNLKRFVYYSAAEVFGPVASNVDSHEDDRYRCNSPYAASKAGGEEMCVAYSNTFGIPVSIIHITNTFGPRCQKNRYPVIVTKKIINGEVLNIHTDVNGTIGGRRWFFAGDVADHTEFILNNQKLLCEKWNSAGERFINNLEFAKIVSLALKLPFNVNYIPIDRPGHDLFFSVSPAKLFDCGYKNFKTTEQKLEETTLWYKQNNEFLF